MRAAPGGDEDGGFAEQHLAAEALDRTAVVFDEREQTAGDKSDAALAAMRGCIPRESAAGVSPVVSITGYEGEIEVRDFLRRAQRDLLAARSQDLTAGRRQQGQQRAASPA